MRITDVFVGIGILILFVLAGMASADDFQKVSAVPFTAVKLTDSFWAPRIQTNQEVTVWHDIQYCEQTGRISNFAKAGKRKEGTFEGIYFNDSDVYKILEGAAYCLHANRDPKLEAKVDEIIDKIASAQQPDGYLMCFYILNGLDKRWTNFRKMHELYCAGHMFEGAIAYYQATGKRKFLNVAIKLADHIDSIFGPDKKRDVPGHEEIELALVKLYKSTGQEKYLKLAKFFLDERGNEHGRTIYGSYCQDHKPVVEQTKAVGHAVRAGYLYSGMTDIAALTGDEKYRNAVDRIWGNIVKTKLYLTGGIGARHGGEAFGEDYELPNHSAYCETCAAIANALWNYRMFLLHGDGKYIDVLERVLYNGFLSGVSLDGKKFFYVNPLTSHGNHHRQAWYGCACCPSNVVRVLPSIGGYVYAKDAQGIYVNLFADSTSRITLGENSITLKQQTRYPWEGTVKIAVEPETPAEFSLNLRIPGWSRGRPIPSDLYTLAKEAAYDQIGSVRFKLNGKYINNLHQDKGYVSLRRLWKKGDLLELHFSMPVQQISAHPNVKDNVDRIALQRGPLVYCLEEVDNTRKLQHMYLAQEDVFNTEHRNDLLNGVTVIQGKARVRNFDGEASETMEITAVPYYAWDNRRAGRMMVWLPTKPELVPPLPKPTIASRSKVTASHCWQNDTVEALHDQLEPKNSNDHSVPRLTWWPRRGTTEWVQYDFDTSTKVSSVEVYWFEDAGRGGCYIPQSWRILYRQGGQWNPVENPSGYQVKKDTFNKVTFQSVSTKALRLEVKLQKEFSGGILEWRVP